MTATIVGITLDESQLAHHFRTADLEQLKAAATIRVLGRDRGTILPQLGDVDILLGSWGMPVLDAELLAAAPRLRAVTYAAGSVKCFVTSEAFARGVTITTAMHANAIPVAEVTVALITLANKNWFAAQAETKAGRGRLDLPHVGNYGATVGLVGCGVIARLVATRLATMDLHVLIYDPYAEAIPNGCERVTDVLDLARRADVVSLHASDVPATTGMCGSAFFQAMRTGATFINTARGRLVDEAALIVELRKGRITAHLDVTHPEPPVVGSPLYALPNVHLTPHLAGSSKGEVLRLGRYAIDDCLALIAGRTPRHPVTQAMLATMA